MKLISAVRSLLLLLCCTTATIRADFTLTLSVTGHSTSGNCFGDDLTGPCETFLSIFCLRDPRQTSSTSTSDCPLGVNHQQIGPDRNSGVRTISSTQPWPVSTISGLTDFKQWSLTPKLNSMLIVTWFIKCLRQWFEVISMETTLRGEGGGGLTGIPLNWEVCPCLMII